jgi:hypothetical protein
VEATIFLKWQGDVNSPAPTTKAHGRKEYEQRAVATRIWIRQFREERLVPGDMQPSVGELKVGHEYLYPYGDMCRT